MISRSKRFAGGFTLLEMTLVIAVLLLLLSVSMVSLGGIKKWRLGRAASESLRTVYIAQRTYLADNPTATVANLTQALIQPYLPNNAPNFPVITSLEGNQLTIRVNVSPPFATAGNATAGDRYDPSVSITDSLWDVGE